MILLFLPFCDIIRIKMPGGFYDALWSNKRRFAFKNMVSAYFERHFAFNMPLNKKDMKCFNGRKI